MKAPAVISCQFCRCAPTRPATATVSSSFSPGPRKMSATSRSFQVHRNWKIANEASAGTDIGTMSRQKVW